MDAFLTVSSTINTICQKSFIRSCSARSLFSATRVEIAQLALRARFDQRCIVDARLTRAIDQAFPRAGARVQIVKVHVVHVGNALQEDRIRRIARVERLEQCQCLAWTSL